LEERLERMTVRAPIAGVVTTFQVEKLLMNRPVARGDVLVQVMDDRSDWQLELEVAEHRMGHLRKARMALGEDRPIEFRLLTKPDATYQAKLTTVGTRVVNSENTGSVVEVRADLESPNVADLAIGAEVRARISCGPKPLGYVLFGDVIEFVQKYLWW
jgi:multidrug efflux pump subunit AcrA (membrane-fusion protein)